MHTQASLKFILIAIIGTASMLIYSACNRIELRLVGSYERMVIPGQQNRKGYLETVLLFNKKEADLIFINKVELLTESRQERLIFINPTITDSAFSKTYSTTVGLQDFALLLAHNKSSDKLNLGTENNSAGQIFYNLNGKDKTVIINEIGPRKTVRLR